MQTAPLLGSVHLADQGAPAMRAPDPAMLVRPEAVAEQTTMSRVSGVPAVPPPEGSMPPDLARAEMEAATHAAVADMDAAAQPAAMQAPAEVVSGKAAAHARRKRGISPRGFRPEEENGQNDGGDDGDQQRIPPGHS